MERYEDRLESSSYANDEVVGAGPSGRADYDGWVWIPERLFSRMQHLAKAYEFHVLTRLDPYGRNSLNVEQVESLLDEVEFIGRVVEDEALRVQLERLRAVAVAVRGAGPRTELVIEGP